MPSPQPTSPPLDGQLLRYFAAKDLVAALHIRQVEVCESIAEQRQKVITERVPEGQDPASLAAGKTRAVDHIGLSSQQRRQ